MNQSNPSHLQTDITRPDDAWSARHQEIKSRVIALLGNFPVCQPEIEAEILKEEQGVGRSTYLRQKVRIRGEDGEWIYAWILIPSYLTKPTPAIICAHPTTEGAGKDCLVGISGVKPGTPLEPKYSYALELASDLKFITVAFDNFHDGERVHGCQKLNDTSDFYHRHPQWSAVGKFVWDTQRILDYLYTRPEVDHQSIGIIGHSLGAHVALFTAALDERIKACVANGGTISWDEGERSHWYLNEYKDGRTFEYIRNAKNFLLDNSSEPPFSFVELAAMIAPRALQIMLTENGAHRQCLPEFVMQLREFYGALGVNERFEAAMYSGGHGFPMEFRWKAYQFLKCWLR